MAEQVLILRKSDHAVTNVARWKNAVFAAQAPRASPIIRHGDNYSQVSDRMQTVGRPLPSAAHVLLYAAQKRRKASAAAQSHNIEAPRCIVRLGSLFFQTNDAQKRINNYP